MGKSNGTVFGIVIGAIAIVAILLLSGVIQPLDESGSPFSIGDTLDTININLPGTTETVCVNNQDQDVDDQADLRLLFQPYIAATDIKDLCLASGAAWHEDEDFVGCVGLGPNSCSSGIVLASQTQCLATGANFYCQTGIQGFLYCRY